jgi:hypothetical protein
MTALMERLLRCWCRVCGQRRGKWRGGFVLAAQLERDNDCRCSECVWQEWSHLSGVWYLVSAQWC